MGVLCGRKRGPREGNRALSVPHTCFQRDRDRILHCKSFRRLSNKTQVFISPEGDHYRARLTHTLEVAQIARTIARALGLNEDLAEAIALGHDLGHTPFGHAGESALNEVCPFGFRHNEQSLRLVDLLEKPEPHARGAERHRLPHGPRKAITPEERIIHFADRIAYINHDIDDAVRGGIIRESDIPAHLRTRLGSSHGERIDTLVTAMIDYGQKFCEIGMEQGIHDDMMELRAFMFEHVYRSPEVRREETHAHHAAKPLPLFYRASRRDAGRYFVLMTRRTARARGLHYVASMTDRYSIAVFRRLFIPNSWSKTD